MLKTDSPEDNICTTEAAIAFSHAKLCRRQHSGYETDMTALAKSSGFLAEIEFLLFYAHSWLSGVPAHPSSVKLRNRVELVSVFLETCQ